MFAVRHALYLFVTTCAMAMAACQPAEGPAERAGKSLDNAASKVGDQIDDAAKKAKDAVKDATK
jgi:hypothetical protein